MQTRIKRLLSEAVGFLLLLCVSVSAKQALTWLLQGLFPIGTADCKQLTALVSSCVFGILALLYCKKIQNRPLSFLRLQRRKNVAFGLLGAVCSCVAVLAAWMLALGLGEGFPNGGVFRPAAIFLLYGLAYAVQGSAEELLFRGYLQHALAEYLPGQAAVAICSALFALAHAFNPGVTLLAVCNLFLLGVFFSLCVGLTDRLVTACMAHTAWNCTQAAVCGTSENAFALEGSLYTTAVLLTACAIAFLLWKRKTRMQA